MARRPGGPACGVDRSATRLAVPLHGVPAVALALAEVLRQFHTLIGAIEVAQAPPGERRGAQRQQEECQGQELHV